MWAAMPSPNYHRFSVFAIKGISDAKRNINTFEKNSVLLVYSCDNFFDEANLFCFVFEMEFRSCYPGWSAMARSRLTATSASWVQAILLP